MEAKTDRVATFPDSCNDPEQSANNIKKKTKNNDSV